MIAAAAVDDDDEKKPREEEEHTKEIERKETPTSHSTFQKRPIVLAEDKEDGYYTHTKKNWLNSIVHVCANGWSAKRLVGNRKKEKKSRVGRNDTGFLVVEMVSMKRKRFCSHE